MADRIDHRSTPIDEAARILLARHNPQGALRVARKAAAEASSPETGAFWAAVANAVEGNAVMLRLRLEMFTALQWSATRAKAVALVKDLAASLPLYCDDAAEEDS